MKILILPTLLLLTLPNLGAAAIQSDGDASEFGEPLVVNGERVDDLVIKRFLLYGPGRNALEARKLELLMKQEKELRVYEAVERLSDEQYEKAYEDLTAEEKVAVDAAVEAELAYMIVPRELVAERLNKQKADFQARYPTLDPDRETRRAYKTLEWYEDQVYQTMRFDEMFFPGHPDTWPEITIEAVHAGSPQYDLVADYKLHWDMRKEEADKAGTPMRREDDMMMSILRDYVMSALASLVQIKTGVDGLEPEVLMAVEGLGLYDEILTADVWEEFKDAFTWREIAEAKRFLALQLAAKQKLTGLGVLQDRDEFMKMVARSREQLTTNMFNWQFVALMGHQFPSEEAYTDHLHLMQSFRELIKEDVDRTENNQVSPALAEYLESAKIIFGIGRCLTEVCFVSAYDFPNDKWRPEGFAGTEKRADALRGEVDAYIDRLIEIERAKQVAVAAGENFEWPEDVVSFDEFWSGFLDLHSEFWDPPMPVSGHKPPDLGRKNRGRFASEPMTRNDYKRTLGESSYYYYLFNTSVADEVFFNQQPGSVGGPYQASHGYYIVYLRSRQPPTNTLDMLNDRHYQMVADDFVRNRYTEFAHEALREAETSGVPTGLEN